MPDIDDIWPRIEMHQGAEFRTASGLPFTYSIHGHVLRPIRQGRTINRNIPRTDVALALAHCPVDGPGKLNRVIQGPAYVWALLHDPRIRQADY